MKPEQLGMTLFGLLFASIAVLTFIGGCVGHVWHFYTSALCAILSGLIFATVKKESK